MPRHPTILDVARLAGVFKATVGRVVNGQTSIVSATTCVRVLDAVESLQYERNAIAGSLRTDKTRTIALCIPDITNPFWPAVVRGVQDTIEAQGYATHTVNSDWDAHRELKFLKMIRVNRLDGLIINPTDVANADFDQIGVPIVTLGNGNGYPDYDSIGSDIASGAQTALEYLFAQGHRRIGLLVGGSARKKSTTRYHSYVAFHRMKEITVDDALVIHCRFALQAAASLQAGAGAIKRLLDLPVPPTAVLAANDMVAIGAMHAAQAMKWRIPEDISIIGMDDIDAASITTPGLTTVAKPKYDIGVHSASLLFARMNGDVQLPVQNVNLPCKLIVRGSTATHRR